MRTSEFKVDLNAVSSPGFRVTEKCDHCDGNGTLETIIPWSNLMECWCCGRANDFIQNDHCTNCSQELFEQCGAELCSCKKPRINLERS